MMKERQTMWRVGLVVSILAASLVLAEVFSKQVEHPAFSRMQGAADRMTRAEAAIAARRVALGIAIDPNLDPYRTGLIGAESSFLTTTVGDIVAKRTTTTTAFAALVVRYFYELGLRPGDRIAVGSSGSFPGILLAVLSACAETGVEPVIITSIGASEYGANIEGLSNAEMVAACRDAGIWPFMPAAISPGSDADQGISSLYRLEPSDELARYAHDIAARLQVPFIKGNNLEESIALHLRTYQQAGPIKAFVNIGGADVNFGGDTDSLKLKPGLILPSVGRQSKLGGLVGYYLSRGIPVIHLLNIKGLALQSGIPIDGNPFAPLPADVTYSRKKLEWLLILGLVLASAALA